MARYKLNVIEKGGHLYWDDGTLCFRADTEEEARQMFIDFGYEPDTVEVLHAEVIRPRVVYKHDVEAGECHEDAYPGDTTYDHFVAHTRQFEHGQLPPDEYIVVWARGRRRASWVLRPPRGWEASCEGRDLGYFDSREDAMAAIQAEADKLGLSA